MKEGDYITAEVWNDMVASDRIAIVNYIRFIDPTFGYWQHLIDPKIHPFCVILYSNSVFFVTDYLNVTHAFNKLPLSDIRKMIELSPI